MDVVALVLGMIVGIGLGPWAWRLGYRVHGEPLDPLQSRVRKPWA